MSKYSISLCIALIITWGGGLILITQNQYIENPWVVWLYGIINAVIAVGLFHLLLTPLAFSGRNYRITPVLIHVLYSGVLLVELLSLFYFSITSNLLDRTIFEFSMDQSMLIMKSYFVFKWYYLLVPFPIILYFLLIRIPFFKKKVIFYLFLFIGIISFFIGFQITPKKGFYTSLSKNKTLYFINSIYKASSTHSRHFSKEDIAFYQKSTNLQLKNKQYPLYRPVDSINPLSPFFNLKETPPNIVVIIVESLSSSYSGPKADEISYTPFLDSLAQHSLYFTNSLATAERSFAALPSILGSLPHGKKGFTNNKSGYPKNETLPTWLFNNGYTGDFHYGGYARFDYMDLFMNDQGFKNIYDQEQYNYEGTGLKTSIDSIPFGIQDRKLFEKILKTQNSRTGNHPFLDVCLTLSMHYPYMIDNHNYYYEKVKDIIQKANVDERIKNKNKKYVKELATFLYTDDALKWYFKQQKKEGYYDNTIYIVAGDHMMGEIAQASAIEKYRSVLMIYSPLLKEHKEIKGTNSHLDIAPSFYQMLENEYSFHPLDFVSWLGQPFDTSSVFQSKRDVLFMLNNRTTNAVLHNELYLSKDKLYKVSDHLRLTPYDNKEKQEFMERLLATSTAVHDDVVTQNKLIPMAKDFTLLANENKTLNIDETTEYSSVYNTVFDQSFERVIFEMNVNFSGDWTPDNTDENNPILVYTLQRGDSTLMWNTVDLKLSRKGVKKDKNYNFIISNNINHELKTEDEVKVYFWNKAMSDHKFNAHIQSFKVKGVP